MLLFFVGCATSASVRRIGDEVANVKAQVAELRELSEFAARELTRATEALSRLDREVGKLTREDREMLQQASRLEARLADAESTMQRLKGSVTELSQHVSRLGATPTPTDGERASREHPPRADSAEKLYASAQANMRAREHGQAVLEFLDFVSRFPTHPLAGSAQYRIGEAYYVQRDYRQAVIEFQKLVDGYEESHKVADALLRIGLSYKALHDREHARQTWEQLVREFPDSEAAREAHTLIRGLALSSGRSG
ncbi:MAG: tol-pal system protein YbgF [Candidatus Methylomirabilia bacterium]